MGIIFLCDPGTIWYNWTSAEAIFGDHIKVICGEGGDLITGINLFWNDKNIGVHFGK